MRFTIRMLVAALACALTPGAAFAAEGHGLPGATMPLLWALPFAGILLCIAIGPLFFPHVWEHHYGKISAFWAALAIGPMALCFGFGTALYSVLHTILL